MIGMIGGGGKEDFNSKEMARERQKTKKPP